MSHFQQTWASIIIEELIRCGVEAFCIAPGSRSTPLTLAVSQHPQVHSTVHYDERGCGFVALGYARATGKPSVIITTSGTAVANLFPAVIEAYQSQVPLIVLTADRPPEYQETGANQSIPQHQLFGAFTRWCAAVPCPDFHVKPAVLLTTVDQAVFKAIHLPGGPVHINCMFREPFIGQEKDHRVGVWRGGVKEWKTSAKPFTEYSVPEISCQLDLSELANNVKEKQGIILVGEIRDSEDRKGILELAEGLGWPIYPSITSGLCSKDHPLVVQSYDAFVTHYPELFNPEVVIQLGAHIISKKIDTLISEKQPYLVQVMPHGNRQDPSHSASFRVTSSIKSFCDTLTLQLDASSKKMPDILEAAKKVRQSIDKCVNQDTLTEPLATRIVSRTIPEGHGLFLANSLPVRLMELLSVSRSGEVAIAANRGASGIDGTIASAVGYALGKQSQVTCLIGDLSFCHDMNSLSLLKAARYPVVFVVLNNNGGGIFSLLPIVEEKKVYQRFFQVGQDMDFQSAASQFGVSYYQPKGPDAFEEVYKESCHLGESAIIEVQVPHDSTQQFYHQLADHIRHHSKVQS
ncbi:MAG: 2-succinyl-5-enolpyruvyl-6-hydroxy-3-cyclohexene-1-carboxylic-acid synthase [Candidatus Margulisbacteria bacterium]|nr:2-succinyl-5-enolpyruvyl-6-hydroxy-3-cyclohexene-1-carboxylic-acid synthase [Candidatus Margulisiibacteriota bacterium]